MQMKVTVMKETLINLKIFKKHNIHVKFKPFLFGFDSHLLLFISRILNWFQYICLVIIR